MSVHNLKVRQNQNDFFKADISLKKRTKLFNEACFLLFFWRKFKTTKRHFEINWPLANTKLKTKLFCVHNVAKKLRLLIGVKFEENVECVVSASIFPWFFFWSFYSCTSNCMATPKGKWNSDELTLLLLFTR